MVRRLSYLLVLMAWIALMTLPLLAFLLAARGELMVGDDQGSNVRLFLVNSDEAKGIGIQRVRKSSQEDCFQGSVRYLLWEGQDSNLNVDYCTCVDPASGFATVSDDCQVE